MKAREFLYYGATLGFGRVLSCEPLLDILRYLTFQATSDDLMYRRVGRWLRRWWPWIVFGTMALLLGVNGAWAALTGRFGFDGSALTRQFLEDWPNLLNYAVLCPVYVLFDLAFLRHVLYLRSDLERNGCTRVLGGGRLPRQPPVAHVSAALVVLFVSLVIIAFYSVEIEGYDRLFWFQAQAADPFAQAHTSYYHLTNLILALLTFGVAAAHIETFSVAGHLGRRLKELRESDGSVPPELLDGTEVRVLFAPLLTFYTLSKVLALVYLANLYTWKWQGQDAFLLDLSILALALVGVGLISYPRYHIQSYLFQIWRDEGRHDYPELRTPLQQGVASTVDVLIIGTAMTNLIVYVLGKVDLGL